MTGTHR